MTKTKGKPSGWFFVALFQALVIIALILWIAGDASAEDTLNPCASARYWVLDPVQHLNGLYNECRDDLPFTFVSLADPHTDFSGYDYRDTRLELYVLDRQDQTVIHLYENNGEQFATVWDNYTYGDDGNPHPDSWYIVSGWNRAQYLGLFYQRRNR